MAENDSCIKRSAIILTAFGLFFVTWYFNLGVRPFANFISTCKSIHYILHYLIAGIIPAAALLLLHRPDTILYRLGLTHDQVVALRSAEYGPHVCRLCGHRQFQPGNAAGSHVYVHSRRGILRGADFQRFRIRRAVPDSPLGISAGSDADGFGIRIAASVSG